MTTVNRNSQFSIADINHKAYPEMLDIQGKFWKYEMTEERISQLEHKTI